MKSIKRASFISLPCKFGGAVRNQIVISSLYT